MTVEDFEKYEDPHPPGSIVLWTGDVSDIPRGWLICDGNNGTPNLLGKFLKGVPTASTEAGSTGGENSKSLSESQIPNHSHTASINTAGNHNHGLGNSGSANPHDANNWLADGNSSNAIETTNNSDWNHSHNFTSDSVGSSSSIDNQPAYREAHYIQKS